MKNRYKIFVIVLLIVVFSSVSIYSTIQGDKIQKEKIEKEMSIAVKEKIETIAEDAKAVVEQKAKEEAEAKAKAEAEAAKAEAYKKGLASYISSVNGNISNDLAWDMAGYFINYGNQYGVDPEITVAIAQGESTFYPDVVSSAESYKGLMQTSDGLAMASGYSPDALFNPEVSILVGTKHIGEMINNFGDTMLGLSAYAYGSGAVSSGNYNLDYAERVLSRVNGIKNYLSSNGYI